MICGLGLLDMEREGLFLRGDRLKYVENDIGLDFFVWEAAVK